MLQSLVYYQEKAFRLFSISNKRGNLLYSELTVIDCSLENFLRTSTDIQYVGIVFKKERGEEAGNLK